MLIIDNISKQYSNGYWGIKEFTLEIENGQVVCIAGPNGSGKTTIIECALELISLTEGSVTYNNFNNNTLEYKRKVGYVPDEILLIEALTGNEYINFVKNIYEDVDNEKLKKLIELFNMKEYLDEPIETYSHGMKKKVQIVSAFMLNCSIIVMDEPTRGLDIEAIIILKKLMRKFISKGGGILLSTHNLISAESMCDKIAIIAGGKKLAEGNLSELKEKYNENDLEGVFMKCSLLSERSDKIEEIINDI